jgi:hypothetical protein
MRGCMIGDNEDRMDGRKTGCPTVIPMGKPPSCMEQEEAARQEEGMLQSGGDKV